MIDRGRGFNAVAQQKIEKPESLENRLAHFVRRTLPDPLLKYVPTLYYAFNRYRYRLVARPTLEKETHKARARRVREGFFEKYCQGQGLDVGYGGDPVTPDAQGWDIEDGDAHYLHTLPDAAFDFVYSSHVLEHLEQPEVALANWWRVLKPGGYLLLYIPDRDLYEKKLTLPSRFSLDHKHYFLLDCDESPHTIGLLPLIERTLDGVEIISANICSEGCTITDPHLHSNGEYSMEVVVRKRA